MGDRRLALRAARKAAAGATLDGGGGRVDVEAPEAVAA
jgi:hypothetical protein